MLIGKRTEGALSLSPSSLRQIRSGQRLVMPSLNGSSLACEASKHGKVVVAGCLRNARTVAHYLRNSTQSVTVIAAGERWSNGSLRSALEDMVGAGAILSGFDARRLSPEAKAAVAVFESAKSRLQATLIECVSGRELQLRGFEADVKIASQLDESSLVPVLSDGAFQDGVGL